ncbi:MAG: DUF4292 domain-containing protein [Candidatus Marinimicrobia bacterium]|nr:DUF4292 domain-containing protein [Candidatus Neomarinimicrobiota bacterium]
MSTTKTLPESNLAVEDLILALNENKEKLKSMEAEARIAIDIRDMAQVGKNYIKIKMPSYIEMSIRGPLGIPISEMKIDSSYYILKNYLRNETFEGNPQSFSFSGISFREGINEFIEVVTGLVTISELEAKNIKNFKIDGKSYYFETSINGVTKFNWIDKEKLILTKQIVTYSEENYKIEKRFEEFQIINGITLPRIIHFISDEIGGAISMEYIDTRINIIEEMIP